MQSERSSAFRHNGTCATEEVFVVVEYVKYRKVRVLWTSRIDLLSPTTCAIGLPECPSLFVVRHRSFYNAARKAICQSRMAVMKGHPSRGEWTERRFWYSRSFFVGPDVTRDSLAPKPHSLSRTFAVSWLADWGDNEWTRKAFESQRAEVAARWGSQTCSKSTLLLEWVGREGAGVWARCSITTMHCYDTGDQSIASATIELLQQPSSSIVDNL